MFFGDDLAPYRLYISDIAKPWSTITGNIVDLLDGTTLEITGVGRSENMLTVFKNDTLFVFTPTGNDDFPFRVEVRQRDVGGVAPFGIANVDSLFFYPNERGIYLRHQRIGLQVRGGRGRMARRCCGELLHHLCGPRQAAYDGDVRGTVRRFHELQRPSHQRHGVRLRLQQAAW